MNPVRSIYDHRPDPFRGFKLYNGGYDLKSSHYWAAMAFTGVHGYVIALIWISAGIALLGCYLVKKKNKETCTTSSSAYYQLLIVALILIVFTMLALVASVIAIITNHRVHTSAKKLKGTLLGAAGNACHSIHRVLHSIKEIHELLLPYSTTTCLFLSSLSMELSITLAEIREHMRNDDRLFNVILGFLFGATLGIVSLNLAIITAAIAMKEFNQNPKNSSLGLLFKCPKPSNVESTMTDIGFGIHSFINKLNSNMSILIKDAGFEDQEINFRICDPFFNPPKYNYNSSICSNNSVPERNDPYLSKDIESMISSYINSIKEFATVVSDLRRLIDCSFIIDAVNHILNSDCKALRFLAKLVFFDQRPDPY
ncbi:hypothetical protein J5N97_015659 [Dioscorea zingiberensis]|uniref:Uncharacterized protein n=1 Tax=Dioscorea zingiberensis TaxID=325984 RepID=A0A9D5CIU2_9LILI|nr:hypothetical protein J5N97_015659 [Dioscorea zingiberensis]